MLTTWSSANPPLPLKTKKVRGSASHSKSSAPNLECCCTLHCATMVILRKAPSRSGERQDVSRTELRAQMQNEIKTPTVPFWERSSAFSRRAWLWIRDTVSWRKVFGT